MAYHFQNHSHLGIVLFALSFYTVCGLNCDVGFVANSSCNGCVSVCDLLQPCGQFGSCHLNSSSPDGYMCTCNAGYTGQNCTGNSEESGVNILSSDQYLRI